MLFPMFLPLGGGGAGKAEKPRTNGGMLLGIIGGSIFIGATIIGYIGFGPWGLTGGLALAILVAWCFGWVWLANECLNHAINSKGIRDGVYMTGFIGAFAVALISFVAALGTVIKPLVLGHW